MVIERAIIERLNLLLHFECDENDSWELVRKGLVDPVKLFVKCEPHKIAKLNEGRVRLIFSMSLVDNTIARLLFSAQNVGEIEVWDSIPSKPGMGLNDEGLSKIFQTVVQNSSQGLMETDIKGWDWSFQELDFIEDLKRRTFLNNGSGTFWERIARSHYHCVARKVMCLSDGSLIKQTVPGVMPSGWYNTSSTNSAVRAMAHYHAALKEGVTPWCITMGDDSIERYVPRVEDHYRQLGKTCGLVNVVDSSRFEFCSTNFVDGIGIPVNVDKQLVNLMCSVPRDYFEASDRYEQFLYELRHHPDIQELNFLVCRAGYWSRVDPPDWYGNGSTASEL